MATSTNVKNNLSVVADAAAAKSEVAAASVDVPEPPIEFANLDAPELYLNRELTWLEFNRRVLHEAQD